MLKKVLLGLSATLVVLFFVAGFFLWPMATRLGGAAASGLCNQIYSEGISEDYVLSRKSFDALGVGAIASGSNDPEEQSVRVYFFGLPAGFSEYKQGYGCAQEERRNTALPEHEFTSSAHPMEFPSIADDYPKTNAYVAREIAAQGTPDHPQTNHHGFLVLHRGRIVVEAYAAPYTPDSRMPSASMAKSITAMLWSIADDKGFANMEEPANVPEWLEGDARRAITNRHLLDMKSGLDYHEEFGLGDDGLNMMTSVDMAHFVSQFELRHAPGDKFYYSSGDTNLASRSLSLALRERGLTLQRFAEDYLFDPIGADGFELVTDEAGTFIGSSTANARLLDWGRIGQLVLNDGVFKDQQVIPKQFIQSLNTPVNDSEGKYSMSVWLNRTLHHAALPRMPGFPADTRSFLGVGLKYVLIIPSEDLVIVRTGNTARSAIRYSEKFMIGLYQAFLAEKAEKLS